MSLSPDELVALTAKIEREGLQAALPEGYGYLLMVMSPGPQLTTSIACNVQRPILRKKLKELLRRVDSFQERGE